jgi:hypothetical protein
MLLDRYIVSTSFIAWDASETWGIGGFYARGDQHFSIPWTSFKAGKIICDLAPMENTPSWHINYMELYAGFVAIKKWGSSLRGYTVICFTDSSTVHSWLNRMWGTETAIPLLKRMHLMLVRMDIKLQSHLVTSKENGICDALSRGDILQYHSALEAWKNRGESADTYKCPLENVDVVPASP